MIMQIDHVAISSMNFDGHIKIINSLGYKLKFAEKDIENLKIKSGLMRNFSELQNLALLTRENSVGIELLNHRHINSKSDIYIFPIFDNVPGELVEKIEQEKVGKGMFIKAKLRCFDVPIYTPDDVKDANIFQFNKIIIKTRDTKLSMDFWGYFGFKVIQTEKKFAILEFKSLFNKNVYQIYLQEDSNIKKEFFLDDKGFNCIAFTSNSAKNEKESLERKGVRVTEIEKLLLNGKLLNIFFAIGPFRELVEIIGIEN